MCWLGAVCPTTLKRICRQHGITRWPSRKIKKVGHSLKKLQLVMDSVEGVEGNIHIGSFYSTFPQLTTTSASASWNHHNNSQSSNSNNIITNTNTINYNYGNEGSTSLTKSKSSPSSCSGSANYNNGEDSGLNRSHHMYTESFSFRVKASFGDENIRFSFPPNWGLRDLQMEIATRFNLNLNDVVTNIDLKYLDDDGEWVLLTCGADFEECKDLHLHATPSSHSHTTLTIRLSLFQPPALPSNLPNSLHQLYQYHF